MFTIFDWAMFNSHVSLPEAFLTIDHHSPSHKQPPKRQMYGVESDPAGE